MHPFHFQDINPLTAMHLEGYNLEMADEAKTASPMISLKGMGKTYLLKGEDKVTIQR